MSVIRNAKVVLCQLEIDADITLETLKIARQNHGLYLLYLLFLFSFYVIAVDGTFLLCMV